MSRILVLIRSVRSDSAQVALPLHTVAPYRRFFLPAGRRLAEPVRLGCCAGRGRGPGGPRGRRAPARPYRGNRLTGPGIREVGVGRGLVVALIDRPGRGVRRAYVGAVRLAPGCGSPAP